MNKVPEICDQINGVVVKHAHIHVHIHNIILYNVGGLASSLDDSRQNHSNPHPHPLLYSNVKMYAEMAARFHYLSCDFICICMEEKLYSKSLVPSGINGTKLLNYRYIPWRKSTLVKFV